MINKITLIGYLGNDPEHRNLENGTAVGRFSLATSDSYKDKDGNWQSQTEWHNVVVWRDLADRAKNLKKGMMVYVEGKVTYRKYTDKDGNERTSTDVVASTVRSLEKREQSQQQENAPAQQQRQPQQAASQPQHEFVNAPAIGDDLPF